MHQPASRWAEDSEFLVPSFARQDIRIVRGEGSFVYDETGRRYLDAFSGVGVNALGHGHPALVSAITTQAQSMVHVSNHYGMLQQASLARRLVELSFPGKVLFCNSGTEAIEACIKLARLWGNSDGMQPRRRMVAFSNGFHGRTLGALSVTANPGYRTPFEPLLEAEFIPYGDAGVIDQSLRNDVAAVFIEIVQGEGGLATCPPGFLQALRRKCDETGALLVIDEVMTGIGRTGTMFAFEQEGVLPDLLALAKGLGGGFPIGAVVARVDVAARLQPGLHGSTFAGGPLACACAHAVLDVVGAPSFLDGVRVRATRLANGVSSLFPGKALLGRGMLLGIRLAEPVGEFVVRAREKGLIVGSTAHNTLRIAPPLVIGDAEVELLLACLGETVAEVT